MHEQPRLSNVSVGDPLPRLDIPVTAKSIVAGALATRDFHPVHHDADAARGQGARNIFMNILTSNGLVERFVMAWAGPEATIRSVKIRLGAPNYPGDTMVMTGGITARAEDGDAWVDVRVSGANDRGEHVGGTVRVELPR